MSDHDMQGTKASAPLRKEDCKNKDVVDVRDRECGDTGDDAEQDFSHLHGRHVAHFRSSLMITMISSTISKMPTIVQIHIGPIIINSLSLC